MKVFVALVAVLHIAHCGHVSVKLPYLNPAGVTYVSGYQGHGAALTYAAEAGPLQYTPAAAPIEYAAPAVPAKVEAHHIGYAAAQVPAVAAVPFVKHVPTVSHVPVTRFEHQPAVVEQHVDVLKPAISTKKIEVRRPAIEKQFYDIEERVIIRPAGSALVELGKPTSKLQKGPAVVQPLAHAAVIPQASLLQPAAPVPAYTEAIHSPLYNPSSTAAPIVSSSPDSFSEEEAVVVDNAEFRNAQFRNLQQTSSHIITEQQQLGLQQLHSRQQQQTQGLQQQQLQLQEQQLQLQGQQLQLARSQQLQHQQQQLQQQQLQQQELQQQELQHQQLNQNDRAAQNPAPRVETRSNGSPLETIARIASQEQGPALIRSRLSTAEENQINRDKLIDLLTAHGGVTEIGFGFQNKEGRVVDVAGQNDVRVLSVTPAPYEREAANEHVSTKRVVLSRPLETLQEYDIVEPATKLERVAVQQPTLIKTARLDHVQVHGSVPVVGKALAPATAHAAVPVYQKTISPAYNFYHY